jgi:hypothetical protein
MPCIRKSQFRGVDKKDLHDPGKVLLFVIPAKAGIQRKRNEEKRENCWKSRKKQDVPVLGSRLRGNDKKWVEPEKKPDR